MIKHTKLKEVFVIAMLISFLFSPQSVLSNLETADYQDVILVDSANPKNVILMIGDGMGYEQLDLMRLVEFGDENDNLAMETLPHFFRVGTDNFENLLTDSAAAGTAIATGSKTENGRIAECNDGRDLKTILEISQDLNLSTGLVTTTTINHATPASFATHEKSRNNLDNIADQLIISGVDVLLGGGKSSFDAVMIDGIQNDGYTFVEDKTSLDAASGKVWGMFSQGHMPYESVRDYENQPSLQEMSDKTIELLSATGNGFFLMVEGGRIDHAGHDSNLVNMALETIEFDKAVKSAYDFAINDGNTLLIVTADHETGGLEILGNSVNTTLPVSGSTEAEKREIRINRANAIDVTWSTGYHTDQDIPFFAYGEIKTNLANGTTIDNTDIFSMMKNYIDPLVTIQRSEPCQKIKVVGSWTTGVKVGDQAHYNYTTVQNNFGNQAVRLKYPANGAQEYVTLRTGDQRIDKIVSINDTVIMFERTLYSFKEQETHMFDLQPVFRNRVEIVHTANWPFLDVGIWDSDGAWGAASPIVTTNQTLLRQVYGFHPTFTVEFTSTEIVFFSDNWFGGEMTIRYDSTTGWLIDMHDLTSFEFLFEYIDDMQPEFPDITISSKNRLRILSFYNFVSLLIVLTLLREKRKY